MHTTKLILGISSVVLSCFAISCDQDNDSSLCNDALNVIQNTYTGNVDVTSTGLDPAADFTGDSDSGTYSFEWCNPQSRASLNFDVTTTSGGTVRFIVKDELNNVVLDKTRPDAGNDTFSGVTDNGAVGKWIVTVEFNQIDGDGSFSLHPGD